MVEVVINEFLASLAYIWLFAFRQHGVSEAVAVLVNIVEGDWYGELILEISQFITQQGFGNMGTGAEEIVRQSEANTLPSKLINLIERRMPVETCTREMMLDNDAVCFGAKGANRM